GLPGSRHSRGNRLLLGLGLKPKVNGVQAHQWLTALDGLAGIHQALKHLPGNPKPQVALNPSDHNPGE
ncbi:hypothetical protein C5I_0108150, partial [Pseudomonas syringae pv. syringae FF5]